MINLYIANALFRLVPSHVISDDPPESTALSESFGPFIELRCRLLFSDRVYLGEGSDS